MKAKVETLENDINAVIAEYPNFKFVDLKFNVERGEPRQALLSIDVIENDTVPYRFKVKHFLGRGRTAKFWFGSPPKDNFDAMLNGFTDAHPKIKVRQTRHITNLGVVTDMFIVYSELKS